MMQLRRDILANFKIEQNIKKVRLDKKILEEKENIIVTDVPIPSDAPARMKVLKAEGKKWYLTVVYLPESEKPFALFCTTNHHEKTAQTKDAVDHLLSLAKRKGILESHIEELERKISHENNVNKLTRTISLLLRHQVSIPNIVNTLDQVQEVFVGTFLFHIKKFLSQYIQDGQKVEGATCSNCGSTKIIYSEGCSQCLDCGSSKCG